MFCREHITICSSPQIEPAPIRRWLRCGLLLRRPVPLALWPISLAPNAAALARRGTFDGRTGLVVGGPVLLFQVHLQPTLHARVPVILDVIVGPIGFREPRSNTASYRLVNVSPRRTKVHEARRREKEGHFPYICTRREVMMMV